MILWDRRFCCYTEKEKKKNHEHMNNDSRKKTLEYDISLTFNPHKLSFLFLSWMFLHNSNEWSRLKCISLSLTIHFKYLEITFILWSQLLQKWPIFHPRATIGDFRTPNCERFLIIKLTRIKGSP